MLEQPGPGAGKQQDEPSGSGVTDRPHAGNIIRAQDLEMREQKIGDGGFGDVHLARWMGTWVAVKELKPRDKEALFYKTASVEAADKASQDQGFLEEVRRSCPSLQSHASFIRYLFDSFRLLCGAICNASFGNWTYEISDFACTFCV